MGSVQEVIECDVLIVGAGLSGIASLYKLRKQGFKAKIIEAGSDFGGTWYWNRYPGARVDSEIPFYQLAIPEVWKTWEFTQRFPDQAELRRYFAHVDKICGLRNDTYFNTRVVKSSWDEDTGHWIVHTDVGLVTKSKYLVVASGSLDKQYTPDFPGLADFKGETYHSRTWPADANLKGKKVAVIGAGATGIQVVQELAKQATELTVFIRRPSTCLPMCQKDVTKEDQVRQKASYEKLFRDCRLSWSGFPIRPGPKAVDLTAEQREAIFEEAWNRGGFAFLVAFSDARTDPVANRIVYDFWKKKVRAKISDPVKQEILAPTEPLYYFGTKRSPLEQDYYEMLDQDHVKVVSLRSTPFQRFCSSGVIMEDGSSHNFDALVLATGFESFTGSYYDLGLKGRQGIGLQETWAEEIHTNLGLLIRDFPNLFMVFGPQSPTTLYNGPTTVECQSDLVTALIAKAEEKGAKWVETTKAAEEEWARLLEAQFKQSLVQYTPSWWTRANVPGAKVQPLTYLGGIMEYEKLCREAIDGGSAGLVYEPCGKI
ncbi:uncharacterized protein Z519_07667 [Cladophialophora bantiana CBS 173.52]|uniref:FAD/NAD(P)-binding domain-containing protein n=1 Tax=Cladophialophora bantiana (strain ATCC 10958 / CBS 173.52 / CDC B-1940 / NIH 8579) TaxID=1442370 RepID=A0A0D2I480_CLAB1|nr:uncharacterized protein Z519_07667 [Cladophialophora bantiana CBS 173.52]KIW91699.1 hypothetical protein Z519_07667 [Cladophialophora bantiana CBS 173.52]